MKKFDGYITSDGEVHQSYQDAKRHAEKKYANQLTRMAHILVKIDKHTDMVDKLDGFKGSMQHLLDLAEDLRVEEN